MSNKIRFLHQEHIITRQKRAEKNFLAAFAAEKPTFEAPMVILNPYLINPLCALVVFTTPKKVAPTLTVHGKRYAREDLTHTFATTTEHFLPVLGLYENCANKVTVSLPDGRFITLTITTDKLPADICRCLNIQATLDYLGDNLMFLSPAGKNLPTAYDYKGDIRWLLTENTMFDIKRMKNGNIVTGSSRFCHMPYNSTGLFEINMLGKVHKEFRMPGNYHHDHFEMEDGNLLALTQDFSRDTVEDMCVLLDRNTGGIIKTWDYRKALPSDVGGSGSQDAHDWFHNNAVWYDRKTHSLTLSGRHQDAIVNIDYETGNLNWIIGDPEGWPQELVDKYFFKPVGDLSTFDWQYEQHACVICPNGDVMCFDNGQYRAKVKEKYIENRHNFSRGVRYRIDTDKMEIEQVWQYGKERGQDFFSAYICNVEFYADGHYMIHSGGIGREDGYASKSLGAFLDMNDPRAELRSITVEEKNGVVLYQLETEGNFYRAEKLSLYHDGDNLVFGDGQLLGSLEVTEEFGTIPETEEVLELPPSFHNVLIEEDEDRFVFHGKFEKGTLAMLCLENEGESRHYFINTAAVLHLAMCSGAFLEKDDRDVKIHISKLGLSGEFKLKLIVNDTKYQTGVTIYCP
ncbi:MAG: aryl-sulfate sulfotransferase [Desulfobulbaceae bacterium]|jgi:arylsulfate sulfotransferase|nr:aryl-sulfate sulfotransferase [Desulfobulbaceae bacterium]